MLDDAYGFEPSIRDLLASRYTNEQLSVFLAPLSAATAGSSIYVINKTVEAHTICCYLPLINHIAKTASTKKQLILVGTSQKSHALMKDLLPLAKAVSISVEELIEPVPGVEPEFKAVDAQILVGTMKAYLTQIGLQDGLASDVETVVCEDLPAVINMGYSGELRNLLVEPCKFLLFSREENSKAEALLTASGITIQTLVLEDKGISLEALPQEVYHANKLEKIPLLLGLAERHAIKKAIVICNQKSTVEYLAKKLQANGIPAGWILSYVSRKEQKETLDSFDEGKIAFLVTNDRSLSYIHTQAPYIINFDIPQTPEAYKLRLHHAADTPEKRAISFACEEYVYGLPAIEAYLGFKLPVIGFDQGMLKEDKAKHIQEYRGYGGFSRDGSFGRDRRDKAGNRDRGSRDRTGGTDRSESRGSTFRSDKPAREGSGQRPSASRYAEGKRPHNQAANRSYREGRQAEDLADNPKLYTMSAEERLKLYQQKYANRYEQNRDAGSNKAGRKPGNKQGSSSNNRSQGRSAPPSQKRENKPASQGQPREQMRKQEGSDAKEQKQGSILQGILNIFKPKKHPKDKE